MKSWKLWIGVASLLVAATAVAERVPPGTNDAISARLEPFGKLCRSGEECAQASSQASASGPMSGEQVFQKFCSACHATGVAGAPKAGDAADWKPRIAKGMDTLWQHALHGFNAMPPKGTCATCSDEELHNALDYMVGLVQ